VARGIEEAIRTTRTLTAELSPPVLYELGLEAALGWLVERERDRTGLALRYETNGEADLLDDDASVLVFQSVRELLWNIGKHSGAGAARVVVGRRGGELLVTVEDDGKGFDASREPSGNGFGLISIREKVEHMGGRLTIDSHEGRGTRVAIAMPLGPRDAGGGRAIGHFASSFRDYPSGTYASIVQGRHERS
jgi:signal transduction histidine kinase